MSRGYTKMKHLEPIVFARKQEGHTNAEIAAELGLSTAQIKGLVKRFNRREREDGVYEFEREAIRTQTEFDAELDRVSQEVEELQNTIKQIEQKWEQIAAQRKVSEKE